MKLTAPLFNGTLSTATRFKCAIVFGSFIVGGAYVQAQQDIQKNGEGIARVETKVEKIEKKQEDLIKLQIRQEGNSKTLDKLAEQMEQQQAIANQILGILKAQKHQ